MICSSCTLRPLTGQTKGLRSHRCSWRTVSPDISGAPGRGRRGCANLIRRTQVSSGMDRYLSAPLRGAEAFLPTESCTALLEYPLTQSSGKKQLLLEEDRLPAAERASRLQRTLRRSRSRSG